VGPHVDPVGAMESLTTWHKHINATVLEHEHYWCYDHDLTQDYQDHQLQEACRQAWARQTNRHHAYRFKIGGASVAAPWIRLVDQVSVSSMRQRPMIVNGKVVTFDDIVAGYEKICQGMHLHSASSMRGVSLQQDPSDAFVLADMLWRVRPDLLIELGSSGGGAAVYFANIMAR
jgi:hypothetical protein